MNYIFHDIVFNTTPFSIPPYQPPWYCRMCLRQPFQLLTSSPVPVKDNTCNNNENETFATNDKKQQQQQKNSNWTKFQLLRQNERKTETNKQSNKHL